MKKRAFTLLELLVVVALMGLLVLGLFAPLLILERNIKYFRQDSLLEAEIVSFFEFIKADMNGCAPPPDYKGVIFLGRRKQQMLDKRYDEVYFFTTHVFLPYGVGTVVYKVVENKDKKSLYRYELYGVMPFYVTADVLKKAERSLVFDDVQEFRLRYLSGSKFADSYMGNLPPLAVEVQIKVAGKTFKRVFRIPIRGL